MLPYTKEDHGKELIIDPLKSFITLDGNHLREFPWFKPVLNQMLKVGSYITLNDLENLFSIVSNTLVDIALRQSSLDQIIESLVSCKFQEEEIQTQFIPKIIRKLKSELSGWLHKIDLHNDFFKSVLKGFIKLIELFPQETR